MTRVDKINEGIRYLYIDKQKSIREIREVLLNYDIDLSLFEILSIVQSLNFVPVKPRKKTARQQQLDRFRPFMLRLLEISLKHKFSSRNILEFLEYKGVRHPSRWLMDNL